MHTGGKVKKVFIRGQAEISQNTGRGQNSRQSNTGKIQNQSQREHKPESKPGSENYIKHKNPKLTLITVV